MTRQSTCTCAQHPLSGLDIPRLIRPAGSDLSHYGGVRRFKVRISHRFTRSFPNLAVSGRFPLFEPQRVETF